MIEQVQQPKVDHRRPPFKGRRGPVPYIASWSGEEALPVRIVETASGIGYADETLLDRDDHGVLWNRVPSRPGTGEPMYSTVHPLRQRRAMRRLLCQVCAGPADHNEHGTLWLLRDHREDWANWPEGMGNTHPPLCLRCAHIAVKACPWLTPGFVAVRAHSTVVGVSGALYRAGHSLPRFVTITTIAYTDPPADGSKPDNSSAPRTTAHPPPCNRYSSAERPSRRRTVALSSGPDGT